MFTKEKINTITTALGLTVVAFTILSENDFIDKRLGRTVSGLATGFVSVLVCADKSQLASTIQSKSSQPPQPIESISTADVG